tara:strand:- start:2212 stop:3252 length:1041 start_codon:yes stop_codon:yes gene_type:complete
MAYTTINDPSTYFQTQLFTGTGSSLSVTNTGNANLQPDWVWIKNRDISASHVLTDTTRGATKSLFSDQDSGQATETQQLTSFNSDGFTVGTSNNVNGNGNASVAWQWKANGGTTSSNGAGSITSTVQANTTAGFSVVSYVGNGVNGASVGHGLTAIPSVIIFKRTDGVRNWMVYHQAIGPTKATFLDLSAAADTDSVYFSNTAPTSGIFYLGTNNKGNGDGTAYIAYCFAEKQGYSKFGSYTGNGSADGSFVYTGFSPAWVVVKRTDSGNNWHMHDNKRAPYNSNNKTLYPNLNNPEATEDFDMLSNGFKLRESGGGYNADGGTYIYMAFAQNPLVATNDVIALAR